MVKAFFVWVVCAADIQDVVCGIEHFLVTRAHDLHIAKQEFQSGAGKDVVGMKASVVHRHCRGFFE